MATTLDSLAMTSETTLKVNRIVQMLAIENLDGLLLSSQHNFSWLTGGARNSIDSSREAGAGALLVGKDGRCFVLANPIEMPRLLSEELSNSNFEPVEFAWEDEQSSSSFLEDKAFELLGHRAQLGSDLNLSSNSRFVEAAVARCRYQLTDSELEKFRRLGLDAGEAIGELVRTLEPGQTEQEVAARVVCVLAARGVHAVVNLIAADDRIRNFRHPVPTDRRWKRVLMVVVCARRSGLIVSLTRIICSGSVPDELCSRTMAAARVNAQLLAATTPGATGAELYAVAARSYADEGFPGEQLRHHQGGACGYRTRDWLAHPKSAEVVCLKQAFAWNPTVTGSKVEDTCIVQADGVELITATPDWPKISLDVNGRVYYSTDVLAI